MKKRSSFRFRVSALLVVFFALGFLLPASRTGDEKLYLLAAAVPGVILFILLLPSGIFRLDRPSVSAALSLCGFGLLAVVNSSPDEALSQGLRCAAAVFFLAAGTVLVRSFRPSVPGAALPAVCGLGMISCSLWFPDLSFSLAESGLALLLFGMAAFLSLRLRLPALLVALGGTALLFLNHDLCNAFVWGLSCILVFWASAGSAVWSGILLGGMGGLFGLFLGFSPLSPGLSVPSGLYRIASMPLMMPESLPESTGELPSDSLFLLLGEQYGLVFLLCAVLLLILLLIRGASVAQHTRKPFHASLALGIILLLGLHTLVFLASAAGLVHFAPGCFPFMTSSLPDLFSQFFLLRAACFDPVDS